MRKFLSTLAFFLAAGSALAQEIEIVDSARLSATDRLYLQLYGGTNKSANEHMPWSEFSHHPWSGGAFVAVGQELTPLWGWRATFGIDGNKSRNVPKCEEAETWGWSNLEWWADATFDLTDALRPHDAVPSPFNMKLFAGAGALYTFGFPQETVLSYTDPYSRNSKMNFGFRAGLNATYAINEHWRVGAQLSHFFAADQFNGVDDGRGMDMRSNLKVGVTYIFGPRGPKILPPVDPPLMDFRLKEPPELDLIMVDPEPDKKRQLEGRSFLDFPVNEMVIYPKYRNNPKELKRIYETIEKVKFDNSIEITSILLHGYASPESPYSNNTRLANGRVAALARDLKEHFKLGSTTFTLRATPEDWDNLRSYLADNAPERIAGDSARRTVKQSIWYNGDNVIETPVMPDFVQRYRDELIAVIDSDMEPDPKEEVLKRVGGGEPYRWLHKNVYPGLRHTDYIINYKVKEYSVTEGRKLIYTHPEAMSIDEMYRVAQSYPRRSDEWFEALTTAARIFPADNAARINAAIACIETRRLRDARRYLDGLASPEANYLRDVIAAMDGSSRWKMVYGKVVLID